MNVSNLQKKYRRHTILENVTLKIESNQIVFLMGANGTGKTTFMKCLLNLEHYQGTIQLPRATALSDIAVVFDDVPFYSNLSGYQNLSLFAVSTTSKAQIVSSIQPLLDDNLLKKKVKHYSYGQKKKLAIALCILNKPKYIFMDEVSNGLDYETMQDLKKLLKNWSHDALVFLTGHQFDFYNDIVDTVLLIKDHTISLYDDYNKQETKEALSTIYENTIQSTQTRI